MKRCPNKQIALYANQLLNQYEGFHNQYSLKNARINQCLYVKQIIYITTGND